ncbi:MAG: radical SAM protein [Cyanobacteriota bacterium]
MFRIFNKKVNRKPKFNEPFFLQWHITDKCNLKCKHCYRDDIKKDLEYNDMLDVLAQFKLLLKYINKKGRIQFAGGEPLLSDYLFDIVNEANKCDIPSRILSNGILITEEISERILKSQIKYVQISIDGIESTHDQIRGAGSFKKSIQAAETLRSKGIEVTFNVTVSKLNISELEQIAEIASQYANRLGYHRLVPYGAGKSLEDQLIPPDLVREYFDLINNKIKPGYDDLEVVLRDPLWKPYFAPEAQCPFIGGCSVAYNGICVESNGDVYPCRRMPVVIGNLTKESLIDIWESKIMRELRNRDKLKGNCKKCNLKWLCGGCRAIAYAVTNDYLQEDIQCFKYVK